MRFLLLAFFFIMVMAPAGAFATGQDGLKTVDVEGYGASRQEAIHHALRSAIEEGIGTVLSSQTEVGNYLEQKEIIISRSSDSVRNYSILSVQQQGKKWIVHIKVSLSLPSIRARLVTMQILLTSMDKPKTMVLIQEKDGKNAEKTINNYLRDKGFKLIPPAKSTCDAAKDDAMAAAKLGMAHRADYIIIGSVEKNLPKNDQPDQAGEKLGQASLVVKIINCFNGHIVATKSATGTAVHTSAETAKDLAAAEAAHNLMDNALFETIVSSFQDAANNNNSYDITIRDITDYRLQQDTSRALKKIEGVVSVTKKHFAKGTLELAIVFNGSIDTFCARTDSTAIEENRLSVTNVVGNRVTMTMQKIRQ